MDVIDSFPFTDRVAELDMTGQQILRVLEQSLTLEQRHAAGVRFAS